MADEEQTVPWPVVTSYSGGASHEGIGGRVWIRLDDDAEPVEYVPGLWKAQVIEMLVVRHIYQAKHEDDPRSAIADLLAAQARIDLDPAVSSDAAALVERGRVEERERLQPEIDWLKEALRRVQYEAKSLADAQVIAMETKGPK